MAGEWLKFDASTPEKPEVFAITVALGWDDPDLTVGKLLKVWRWFDQQTIDGNAVSVTLALLDRVSGVPGFAKAMCDVGWLIKTDNGLSLPNFDRHNGKTAKDRALTAKRVANHKANAGANAKGNDDSVTPALPREEIREEVNKNGAQEAKPVTAVDLSIACRKAGVQTQPQDPRLIKLAEQGVLPETVTAACEAAKDAKPGQRMNLGYVVAILETWAASAAEIAASGAKTPAKGGGAWWLSPETKLAKAREVGVGEPLRGESDAMWEARIRAAIDNGGKPPSPAKASAVTVVRDPALAKLDMPVRPPSEEVRKAALAAVGSRKVEQ